MSTPPAFLRKAAMASFVPEPELKPGDVQLQSLASYTGANSWQIGLQHDLPCDLLIWLTRGQGRVTVNGVRRGLGAHNALYIPHGTLFSMEPGAQSLGLILTAPPGLTGRMPQAPLHLRIRDGSSQAELTGQLEAIQRELREERPYLNSALQAHVALCAVWLQRQKALGHADALKEKAAHRLVRRFSERVVQHYSAPLSMADHAQALGVTPTHLTRVCRAACGLTAADILTQRRLFEARHMLSRPKPSVRVVSETLGFTSPAYFTRFIQSHTGLSPSALRRSTQGERRA